MNEPRLVQSQDQRMQMVLAPQMRQSLEILQVPMLELRTLIQQEMEQNPTLEEVPADNIQLEMEPGNTSEPEQHTELDSGEEFEVLARLDDEWREYFNQNQRSHRTTKDEDEKHQFMLDSLSQSVSLQEHLLNQLAMADLLPEEKAVGELIVGNINEDGYLTASIEHLCEISRLDQPSVEKVIQLVQGFDPVGIAARNLAECLCIQLERMGKKDSLPYRLVHDHIDLLGGRKFQDLARAAKVDQDEVRQAAALIGTLDPKPGRHFSADHTSYVTPDVVVRKVEGEFKVFLNNADLPHLHISRYYRSLMDNPNSTDEVKAYIREKVRAGAFLIRSIDQRQQTVRNISEEIVRVQTAFMENGLPGLRPLTMSEVASVVGLHETTISRATSNKYMLTPQGVFELKYFFTPGLMTSDGTSVSNESVKENIRDMVAAEDSAHPLSDQAIMSRLREKGIQVARRTIAKYREELKILPSHMRRTS